MGNKSSKDNQFIAKSSPVEFQTNIMVVQAKISLNRNKKVEIIKKKRKEVAASLIENNIDIAKAKMDSIIREEDLITVYDIIGPICEILKEKVTYLMLAEKCPDDLRAPLDTLIYASTRLEIDELHKIRDFVRRKYGELYISKANANADSLVNINVAEKLKIRQTADPYLIARLKQLSREECIKVNFPQDVIPVVVTPENFNNYANEYLGDGRKFSGNYQPLNYNPNVYPGFQNLNANYNQNDPNIPHVFPSNIQNVMSNHPNDNYHNVDNIGVNPERNNFSNNSANIQNSVHNFQDFTNRNVYVNSVSSGFNFKDHQGFNYHSPVVHGGANENKIMNFDNNQVEKSQADARINFNSQNFPGKNQQMQSEIALRDVHNVNNNSTSIKSGVSQNNLANVNLPEVEKRQVDNTNTRNIDTKSISGKDLSINDQDLNKDIVINKINDLKSELKDSNKNNINPQNLGNDQPTILRTMDDNHDQVFNLTFPQYDNRNNQFPEMNFPTRSVLLMGPKLNEDNAIFPKTQNEKNDEFGSVYLGSSLKSSNKGVSSSNNYYNDFNLNINQPSTEGEFNLIKDIKPEETEHSISENLKNERLTASEAKKINDSATNPDQSHEHSLDKIEHNETKQDEEIQKSLNSVSGKKCSLGNNENDLQSKNTKLYDSASGKIYSNEKHSTPKPVDENNSIHELTGPGLTTTVNLGEGRSENKTEQNTQLAENNLNKTQAATKLILDKNKAQVDQPINDELEIENLFPNPIKSLSSEFPTAKSDKH